MLATPETRAALIPVPYTRTEVVASSTTYDALATHFVPMHRVEGDDDAAVLLVDQPCGFALVALEAMPGPKRRRVLVLTENPSAAYEDCLGSYYISGVTSLAETRRSHLTKLAAAARGERTFSPFSGISFASLRVLRRLLLGVPSDKIAAELRIAPKTVNSHVATILAILGGRNRADLVARILTGGAGRG